jgi:hypothetical protein
LTTSLEPIFDRKTQSEEYESEKNSKFQEKKTGLMMMMMSEIGRSVQSTEKGCVKEIRLDNGID